MRIRVARKPVARLITLLSEWVSTLRADRRTVLRDAAAGLPGAIGSVPDGMATSLLAGVSPIYGLYASMVGPIAGGLFASTARIVVATTSAAALAAGSALNGVPAAQRPGALFLLTALAGIFMVAAAAARLGRFTHFVSYSVMTGFLTGIAVNIILGQLPDATAVPGGGGIAARKALHVIAHAGDISIPTLCAALAALAIMTLLAMSPARVVAALAALAVPSVVVYLAHLHVAVVSASSPIPRGLPAPRVPDLHVLSLHLVTGALAVAIIVLVQGSGVSEAAPNLDGSRSDPDGDFLSQGAANVAVGVFQGQPVGGSVGQTALNVSAGARSRWASVFSGLWMALILVLLSGVVGHVATPTLAAMLIFAAGGSIRASKITLALRTGRISQLAIVLTFAATLLLPVAAAVGVGVGFSLLLQLNREALDLKVVRIVPTEDERLRVEQVPKRLRSRSVTLLDVEGSLLFAGARTLQRKLPDPVGSEHPAVIIRMRGRTTITATAVNVLMDYAERLRAADGRLYLSGVEHDAAVRIRHSRLVDSRGPVAGIVELTDIIGESSLDAYRQASEWVAEQPR